MSENWKRGITKNFRKIKKNLADPESIADYLYAEDIITDEMKEDIRQFDEEPEKMTDRMLTLLLRRGSKALPALHKALSESNEELAELLKPYVEELLKELEMKDKKYQPTEWPPTKEERQHMKEDKVTLSDLDLMKSRYNDAKNTYRMKQQDRGRVLIINNINFPGKTKDGKPLGYREGSDQDEEDIKDLFEQLHFHVVSHRDKTAQEMEQIAKKEAYDPYHAKADCFVCVIMSHGCPEGIYGTDGKIVSIKTLSSYFDSKHCPALNEKPKIFFVQACRGKDTEITSEKPGIQVSNDAVSNKKDGDNTPTLEDKMNKMQLDSDPDKDPKVTGVPTVHSAADFLFAYATPEGYGAWRHREKGSWFLQAVVWTFKYYAHNNSIFELLTKVNDIVSTGKAVDRRGNTRVTVSSYDTSLRKSLFFFPGIVGEHPARP